MMMIKMAKMVKMMMSDLDLEQGQIDVAAGSHCRRPVSVGTVKWLASIEPEV